MEKKCDKIENVPNDFCKFLIALHSCPASSELHLLQLKEYFPNIDLYGVI